MSATDHNREPFLPPQPPSTIETASVVSRTYIAWMRRISGLEWEEAAERYRAWATACAEARVFYHEDIHTSLVHAADRRRTLLMAIDDMFPDEPSCVPPPEAPARLGVIDGGKAGPALSEKPDFSAFWDGEEQPKPIPTLIKKVLPLEGVVVLGGKSGAGKSYLALYMSVCLAACVPFFGHKVRQQSQVLYIAAEGGSTMVPRIAAAKQAAGIGDKLPLRVIRKAAIPSDDTAFAAYVEHIAAEVDEMRKRTGIAHATITIDTVSAAFEVGDENDAAKVTALCKRARRIGERCNALVILIHHFGKDDERLFRGSSAWRDNIDHGFSIITERNNKTAETAARNLNIEKSRIGPEGKLTGYKLATVVIGQDEDGEPWEECAVEQAQYKTIAPKAEDEPRKMSPRSKVFADAFAEALMSSGEPHSVAIGGPHPRTVRAVRLLKVKEEFRRRYPAENPKAADKAWERELDAVGTKGLGYASETDRRNICWIWRPDMQAEVMHAEFIQPSDDETIST
jgi:hypothetical protein